MTIQISDDDLDISFSLSLYRYHHLIGKHSSHSIAVLNGCTTANNYTAKQSNVEFCNVIGVVVQIDFL